MCNALVRGMRHGLCSWINMKAIELQDDRVFSGHVKELFAFVAKSPNTDFVCTLLRAARALQNKTPTQVHKAVDTSNGTVQVQTYQVVFRCCCFDSAALDSAASMYYIASLLLSLGGAGGGT